ncbi:MAG: PIN domain-containing protein [Deltaproteobacteria bacterium]|nr:PIN domain-containing protein [Deltaproteobacteria bacterium]
MRRLLGKHGYLPRSVVFRFRHFYGASWPGWSKKRAVTQRRASRRFDGFVEGGHWAAGAWFRGRSCTTVSSFVDTNILIYAEDRDALAKHEVARELVIQLWEKREGVVSVQVLQELYVNVTRKLKKPVTSAKALEIIREYLTWTVVDNTGALLTSAIVLQQRTRLSFWDSLIVQAAIDGGCDRLYSEDLNPGQRFGEVVVINPFA